MDTFCHFLMRDHDLWDPDMLQHLHIHQAYGVYVRVVADGRGKHGSAAAIQIVQPDTIVYPRQL
jgi:hypothetical protein